MSSCSRDDDDFFDALDKSLRNEYSSQKMSSFMTDLLEAINNLDDDPDEGFRFDDGESDCWHGIDHFSSPSSGDYSEPQQINFRRNKFHKSDTRNVSVVSVDMFAVEQSQIQLGKMGVDSDGEVNSVSVDMFDDESMREAEVRANAMNIGFDNDSAPQSLPVADIALILENESRDDDSIDMFEEFENDKDSVASDEITTSEHSSVADCRNDEADEDSESVTQMNRNASQQPGVLSFGNKSEMINEIVQVGEPVDTQSPERFTLQMHDYQDEQHLWTNDDAADGRAITKQNLPAQQNIQSAEGARNENVEYEACNISNCEANQENVLSVELPTQMPMSQRSLTVVANCPEIVSKKGNLSPDGERAKTSMQSSCQSSVFRGFSPVAPLLLPTMLQRHLTVTPLPPQQTLYASTKLDSDLDTTLCEEYEFSNNFVPILRRSPSGSSIFQEFSGEVAWMNQTSEHHTSMRSSHRSDGGPNSTFCEEYEMDRLLAVYLNATQADHIDLEEAYTQCFSESQNLVSSGTIDRRQLLIDEIEKLVLKIQNDLVNGIRLTIAVPYRVAWKNCVVNDERLSLLPLSDGGTRIIRSKRKIAMIVYVLTFVYKLLINNETCTRREIYYSDPEFTHSQIQVDSAIMDICFVLNAPPWEIGILSSSKGLIAGSIKLTLQDDTVLDVESVDGGILLPQQTMTIKRVETAARFVILVEKHTVYEKLLLENVLNRLAPCILITGKGYPDINTRAMLKKIWDDCKCPIYALVDADPHGIEIMLSYRHGSQKMSLFNDNLAIPSIRWIGVFPSEINKFNLQSLPMTKGDRNRLDSLMQRPYLSTKIYEELLVLKKIKKKSEVEALLSNAVIDCIHSHLSHKIQSGGFI